MVLASQIIEQSRRHTIQVVPDAKKDAYESILFDVQSRGPLLPGRGTQMRERYLRYNVYYHDYNWIARGTCAGSMKKVAATPWEIKGPERLSFGQEKIIKQAAAIMGFHLGSDNSPGIEYYQQILRQADYGRGWTAFIEKGVDFLRQDRGWFWEIILSGDVMGEPNGPVMGIAYLDSLKCRPTGDPDYPVIYFDKHGQRHLMQVAHVRQLVDMPDGDERRPGYGDCAVSRAINIINRAILADQYIEASLDDKPPPGLTVWQGITRQERERAFGEYRKEQGNDERPVWGRQVNFHGMDKDTPVSVQTVAFAQAPEKFDFKVYTELNVNALALAFGIDKQEIWELTGGNIGSQGQSEILNQKSRGKLYGSLYTAIERAINDVLPEEYEFKFKRRDTEEGKADAEIANSWATVIQTAGSNIQPEEARQLLASQSEPVKDAITDENGQIRRVQDLDVQPQEQIVDDANAGALATLGAQPTIPAAPALSTLAKARDGRGNDGDVRTRAGRATDVGRGEPDPTARAKDLTETISAFTDDFSDLITAMMEKDVDRRRFGIVARAQLAKYGRQAFLDGLAVGGVETDVVEGDDADVFNGWLLEQSGYVTDFGAFLKDGGEVDPDARVQMWVNKSLLYANELGKMQSDLNGMYGFEGEDGQESCDTCQRLKGQKHRLKDVNARNLNPKLPGFVGECGGWKCQHRWEKTSGRAIGSY